MTKDQERVLKIKAKIDETTTTVYKIIREEAKEMFVDEKNKYLFICRVIASLYCKHFNVTPQVEDFKQEEEIKPLT